MKPKNIFLFLLVVFGCGLLISGLAEYSQIQSASAQGESTQANQAASQQLLATSTLFLKPSATPPPSVTPTATPNGPATVAAMNLTAAADQVKAAGINATAIIEAANREAAALERKAISDERVAAANVERQKEANAESALGIERQKVINENLRLANEARALKVEEDRTLALYLMSIALTLIAALALLTFLRRQDTEKPAAPKAAIYPDLRPIPSIQVNDKDGRGATQLQEKESEFLARYAERLAVVMHQPMSFRNVQKVIKRADWERVRWELLDLSLAEENQDRSISMNPLGIETIEKLLPHSASKSRDSVHSAGTTQHNTARHAEGEAAPA